MYKKVRVFRVMEIALISLMVLIVLFSFFYRAIFPFLFLCLGLLFLLRSIERYKKMGVKSILLGITGLILVVVSFYIPNS